MSVNVKILFIVFLYSHSLILSQNKPVIKDFPFGKFWYFEKMNEDGSRPPTDKIFLDSGVVYENKVFIKHHGFINWTTMSALLNDNDLNKIRLSNVVIDPILIIFGMNIDKDLEVSFSTIRNNFILSNSEIKKLLFVNSFIDGPFSLGGKVQIDDLVSFRGSKFKLGGHILNVVAKDIFNFSSIVDTNAFYIVGCQFFSNIFFNYSNFKKLEINFCSFNQNFNFRNVKSQTIKFTGNVFRDTIDLSYSYFENGIDLRLNNFDSVTVFQLENFDYPDGKLYVNWDQFIGNGKPRITLSGFSNYKNDDYKRITLIYEKLRDNYLAQGNKEDADNVMYELAIYKHMLIPNCLHSLYGIILGYGYKPWRFMLFILLPLLLFAIVWYLWYYEIVVTILHDTSDTEWGGNFPKIFKQKARTFKKLKISYFDHGQIKNEINLITRVWQVLFFSASVLLSIRFKKDWIRLWPNEKFGRKTFLWFVTAEWAAHGFL